jgi:hypothetical protein
MVVEETEAGHLKGSQFRNHHNTNIIPFTVTFFNI